MCEHDDEASPVRAASFLEDRDKPVSHLPAVNKRVGYACHALIVLVCNLRCFATEFR